MIFVPKFTENEKTILKEKFLLKGEELFSSYGIKKVTVDDLVKAIGIAKGSFYVFYTSKEHLYMDILSRLQQKLWKQVDNFLEQNNSLPPKELTKKTIEWALEEIKLHPMLIQLDGEVIDYLFRKLPSEIIAEHTHDDSDALKKLSIYGVNFNCEIEVATKAFQIYAMTYFQFLDENDAISKNTMNIILNGLVNEIVSE